MTTVIVDYDSGNLHSALKSFQRMDRELGTNGIELSSCPEVIATAERIVLPGVGAFADCLTRLQARDGLVEALKEAVLQRAVPFLGICVGMQLLADVGREFKETAGLGWIPGEVVRLAPTNNTFKIPHIGWNSLVRPRSHAVFDGLNGKTDFYFVHSYWFRASSADHVLAQVDHGGLWTAAVARDNMVGTQFHPEKSQRAGLRLIRNFLCWKP